MAPEPSTMRAKLVAEFLGTSILMFSAGCNVLSGKKVWGTTSIACSLMVSIYALGASPAPGGVPRLGHLKDDEQSWARAVQVAAGVVATFSQTVLFHDGLLWPRPDLGAPPRSG